MRPELVTTAAARAMGGRAHPPATGPTSVADIVRFHARVRGGNPALTCDNRTATFAELDERSDEVAGALAGAGVRRGDRVAFLDTNSIEFFEVLFGAAKAGVVVAAISWRLDPHEVGEIIEDAKAEVVVVGAALTDLIADAARRVAYPLRIIVVGEHLAYERYDQWLLSGVSADLDASGEGVDGGEGVGEDDSTVLQLYTSGTTGRAKGVMLTNRNLMALAPQGGPALQLSADSVNLVPMPLFHIGGSGYALAGIYTGCHTVLVRGVDPPAMLDLIERARVTNAFVVPAVLQFMVAAAGTRLRDFNALRILCYGGSPISADVLTGSMEFFGCDFVQVYGLTETTGTVTLLDAEVHRQACAGIGAERLLSAGKPIDGVDVRVVAGDERDARTGEVGEIWVRSPQVTLGYWRKPQETSAVLRPDGWFRTGDAGYWDDDGYLYVRDRIKDVIISGGENVYPAQIENVLMSHPAVSDAAVIGVPSEQWGETVKAVVVAAAGVPADSSLGQTLIDYCRGRLAHYKCPTSVVFVDALPRNASGKILKRELRRTHATEAPG